MAGLVLQGLPRAGCDPQAFNLDLFCELAQVGRKLEAILPRKQLTRGALGFSSERFEA